MLPTKQSSDPQAKLDVGGGIRRSRLGQGLSLSKLATKSNVSKSNLSKVENNVISPTFEMIEKIAMGLGLSAVDLLSQSGESGDVLSFCRAGTGVKATEGHYEFEFLFTELQNRKMVPFVTTVLPKQTETFKRPASHGGEEFFFVLSGEVEFISAEESSNKMNVGDSVYFVSSVEHLVVNKGDEEARLLWVWLA